MSTTVTEPRIRETTVELATPPTGYKHSDVGMIPEDWTQATIREIATKIGSGITPTGGSKRYKTYGRPFVRSQNVGWGNLLLDDLVFIDENTHNSFSATELKVRDVLLNITGASIGRTALVDDRLVGGNVNQHVCIIRPDPNKAVPRLINSMLLSALGQGQIESFQAGGNRQGLNFSQIASIKLPLPPTRTEQDAIAAALNDIDTLVETVDKLIGKKHAMKLATMQQLLTGTKRLPGFSGQWARRKLGDIAPLQRGFDLPTYRIKEGPHPVVYSNGILRHHAEYMVRGPGIVTGRSGTIGKVNYIEQDFWPHNTSLWVTSFKNNDPKFIFFLYSFIGLERFSTGSGVPTLNRNDVHSFEVELPSDPKEQAAISTALSDLDHEIVIFESLREKTEAVKLGMTQVLLTGRIRLIKPERTGE